MDAIKNEIICPISKMIFYDPVIASDGHVYERDMIEKWLTNNKSSPMTNEQMQKQLTTCHMAKHIVDVYIKSHPESINDVYTLTTKEKVDKILNKKIYHKFIEIASFDIAYLMNNTDFKKLISNLDNNIIKHIIDRCNNYTKKHSIFFTVWEQPNEFAPYRFAALDLTHHNQRTKSVINGDLKNGAVYYTSSIGVNPSVDIDLDKKIEIYSQTASIFQNNSTLQLWLSSAENNKDPKKIQAIITKLLENKINWFSLNSDFSMCPECYHFMKNSQQKCIKCGFDNKSMKVFSKITDYYSPVELWNPGKKQEFIDRKRISL